MVLFFNKYSLISLGSDNSSIPQSSQTMEFRPIHQFKSYYSDIVPSLKRIAQGNIHVQDLFHYLENFNYLTSPYCYDFNSQKRMNHPRSYKMLQKFYIHQIKDIFSKLARFLIKYSKQYMPICLLLSRSQINQLSLNKDQVLYLMSLMALNLVPPQIYHSQKHLQFNQNKELNFRHIFNENEYKTKTIIEYLKDVFSSYIDENQKFIIRRQKLEIVQILDVLKEKNYRMHPFEILSDSDSIEKFVGSAKIDFANRYIGGGSLQNGCVQQEIMFANHTEMYVSILLCQGMRERQAIVFKGFKKHFSNDKYGYQTEYKGRQTQLKYQTKNHVTNQLIVAIDALQFKRNQRMQFSKKYVDRQILKAYTGFNIIQKVDIITGNWGCGAFKGDLELKFLIQWIACSLAGKNMKYCPYGESIRLRDVQRLRSDLQNLSIYEVYTLLIQSCEIRHYQNISETVKKLINIKNWQKKSSSQDYHNKKRQVQINNFQNSNDWNNQKNQNKEPNFGIFNNFYPQFTKNNPFQKRKMRELDINKIDHSKQKMQEQINEPINQLDFTKYETHQFDSMEELQKKRKQILSQKAELDRLLQLTSKQRDKLKQYQQKINNKIQVKRIKNGYQLPLY